MVVEVNKASDILIGRKNQARILLGYLKTYFEPYNDETSLMKFGS